MTHPFKCVEVVWVDSISNGEGWVSEKDLPSPARMTTRGWLVKQEAEYVCIAGTYYKTDNMMFGEAVAIPRLCIVSILVIREDAIGKRKTNSGHRGSKRLRKK